MRFRKIFSALLLFLSALRSAGQSLEPVTRFFPPKGKYDFYDDSFMSGFLQAATPATNAAERRDGFLQMPFTGDPLLVYVGEKDSTQFTAYASGYKMQGRAMPGDTCRVTLTRYGIQASLVCHPAYVEQTYTFPDTTAAKGFLIDIDHALSGAGNEEMDVVFVDKQNIRAFKRCRTDTAKSPQLYYFAHFSAPFDTWNVRRERVALENGEKEARCKVAFTFNLRHGEPLTVQSAVSATSTDAAFSQLPAQPAARHFDDTRRAAPSGHGTRLPAGAQGTHGQSARPSHASASSRKKSDIGGKAPHSPSSGTRKNQTADVADAIFEVKTRDPRMKAAFYAAISHLRTRNELKKAATAADFLQKLAPLYNVPTTLATDNGQNSDTLLYRYAANVFKGAEAGKGFETCADPQASAAAWYVFTSLGLHPGADGKTFQLGAPAFNVASLQMQGGRRLVMYVRRAGKNRRRVDSATLSGTQLSLPCSLSLDQMLHGGMLEVKMRE